MNPLLIGPLFDVVKQALSGLGLDPDAKARAQQQAFDLLVKGDFEQNAQLQVALAQADLAKADAQGASSMQRNWRPMIGWVCAAAVAWDNVLKPMVIMGYALAGHPIPVLPNLTSDQLYGVLFGMLGLGTLRTVEKVKGRA